MTDLEKLKYKYELVQTLIRPISIKDLEAIWPYVTNPNISADMSGSLTILRK